MLPGQPAHSTDVSFLLVRSAPDAAHLLPRPDTAKDTQIASPSLEGLVVLRAPVRGLAWAAEAEAILKRELHAGGAVGRGVEGVRPCGLRYSHK